MRKFTLAFLLLGCAFMTASAQLEGFWVAVDDQDGLEKSVVEIYEHDGKYFGRVHRLLPNATITHCTGCEGDEKDKEITGMVIIKDLRKTSKGGRGGTILDPASGKWYSCYLELIDENKVKMRGYLGMPTFGRSQFWYRKK